MAQKFKVVKVFDCQDMPKDVKAVFFCKTDNQENGGYVRWTTHNIGKSLDNHKGHFIIHQYNVAPTEQSPKFFIIEEGDHPVDDWLYEHGALIGEEVIIKHWW